MPSYNIIDSDRTVTTAGVRVAVTATKGKVLDIMAETNNTGQVVIGDKGVVASLATRNGVTLNAGDFYSIECDDTTKVYIDVTVSTDGVTYTVWG